MTRSQTPFPLWAWATGAAALDRCHVPGGAADHEPLYSFSEGAAASADDVPGRQVSLGPRE